ncbi:hypothetical protein Tco_1530156 [Tanacetum coccineum]
MGRHAQPYRSGLRLFERPTEELYGSKGYRIGLRTELCTPGKDESRGSVTTFYGLWVRRQYAFDQSMGKFSPPNSMYPHSLYPPMDGQTRHPSNAYPYTPYSNVSFSWHISLSPWEETPPSEGTLPTSRSLTITSVLPHTTMGLNEKQRILGFVHGLKTRSLVEFLSTDLPTTYKALTEKTYTWIEAKEVVTNGALVEYREGFDRPRRNTLWGNSRNRNKSRDRDILATKKAVKAFSPPPHMTARGKNRDMSKKGKAKASDTQQGDWKNDDKDNNVVKSPILMIRRNDPKRKFAEQEVHSMGEITFPPVIDKASWTDPVVIKVLVSKRQVGFFVQPLVGKNNHAKYGYRSIYYSRSHKFSTSNGVGTLYLSYSVERVEDTYKKVKESSLEPSKDLLRTNADFFAWTYVDMTGVPRTLMIDGKPFDTEHKLNEYNHIKPIKQKQRGLAPKRNVAARKEVEELTEVGILREVKYKTWVANPIMDIIKGVYCYKKIPFGLKNVGATYQRLVDKAFSKQIKRNLEAYVDDMVIKSRSGEDLLLDI